jgi:hypothetical protein
MGAVGEWGPCTAPSSTTDSCVTSSGVQTRSVACSSPDGAVRPDSLCLAAWDEAAPVSSRACTAQSTCYCVSTWDCADSHKVCNTTSNACDCAPGWSSQACDVPAISGVSCGGVVDIRRTCCVGAVDASTGVCCPGAGVADKHGRCCAAGVLDVCGECGGDGVAVDVHGECCRTPLPPSGECCVGGAVDSCGVCTGDNSCR